MSKFGEIKFEEIKEHSRFVNHPDISTFLDEAITDTIKKIDIMMLSYGDKFPDSSSINNTYPIIENIEWTTSFWSGLLWLAYEHTGDEKYKILAKKHTESFGIRIKKKGADVEHHDLGFLYSLSCIADFKLTCSDKAKTYAKAAADFLITRYIDKAKIIQAWGNLDDVNEQGRMIIDCNMNLPLLYKVSELFNDDSYKTIAYNHVKQAQKYIVRPDASTYHTYYMDVNTGEPKYGNTHQGAYDESPWARGQAWAIYGFMLSYKYTGDESFIELVQKLANFFLNRLPKDLIAYWDLSFRDGSSEPRDSSSNAIVVCGLLELIKYLPISNPNRKLYEDAAVSMMYALKEKCVSKNENENGILKHSTYAKPQGRGIDEFTSWGDYYYFEALIRMKQNWNSYW